MLVIVLVWHTQPAKDVEEICVYAINTFKVSDQIWPTTHHSVAPVDSPIAMLSVGR